VAAPITENRTPKTSPVSRIHFVGRKNSGKTTLIVALVEYFTAQGLRVGTVKHTHHHHELDTPGKDSFRHREAGAAVVGILAPGMTAVFIPREETDLADRYALLEPHFATCDLVLVEGQAALPGRKLEVWRAELGVTPLANEIPSIEAVISDDLPPVDQPIWPRRDLAALAERVLKIARS
jgi:molybdopterin-guanine dinucleotide biosynthesis protein MobB